MPLHRQALRKPVCQTLEVISEATLVCNPAWSRAELVCLLQAIDFRSLPRQSLCGY